MPENRQSNYDQVIENWRLKFLEMDQEELIRKFQLEAVTICHKLVFLLYG